MFSSFSCPLPSGFPSPESLRYTVTCGGIPAGFLLPGHGRRIGKAPQGSEVEGSCARPFPVCVWQWPVRNPAGRGCPRAGPSSGVTLFSSQSDIGIFQSGPASAGRTGIRGWLHAGLRGIGPRAIAARPSFAGRG